MKTINNLLDKIVEEDNIRLALHNAARGRKDRKTVKKALANEDEFVSNIQSWLKSGAWCPPFFHKAKVINDGIQAKKRIIVCPDFDEHVVHHAILQVCKPIFISRFYKHSYSSIPGYGGTENMIKYIRHIFKDKNPRNYKYFVKLDIKKFFDSVNPDTVYDVLKRIIRDKKVLELFKRILTFNNRCNEEANINIWGGIPIGLYASQWFANILLTPLDNKIKGFGKDIVPYYIRYNDDMLLFGPNKRKLNKVVLAIINHVLSIGLELKHEPQIHKTTLNKINFVGAQIDFTTKTVEMTAKTFLKQRRFCLRMSRKIKFCKKLNIYEARKTLVYMGRARHYNMRDFVSSLGIKKKPLKKIVSKHDRRRNILNGNDKSVG